MYGLGPTFCDIIESFYNGTMSSVALSQGTSPLFNISRGVKQGCNLFPFLFILKAEMLAIVIKDSDIAKFNVFDEQISQLGGWCLLYIFLKILEQIPKVFKITDTVCSLKPQG